MFHWKFIRNVVEINVISRCNINLNFMSSFLCFVQMFKFIFVDWWHTKQSNILVFEYVYLWPRTCLLTHGCTFSFCAYYMDKFCLNLSLSLFWTGAISFTVLSSVSSKHGNVFFHPFENWMIRLFGSWWLYSCNREREEKWVSKSVALI